MLTLSKHKLLRSGGVMFCFERSIIYTFIVINMKLANPYFIPGLCKWVHLCRVSAQKSILSPWSIPHRKSSIVAQSCQFVSFTHVLFKPISRDFYCQTSKWVINLLRYEGSKVVQRVLLHQSRWVELNLKKWNPAIKIEDVLPSTYKVTALPIFLCHIILRHPAYCHLPVT